MSSLLGGIDMKKLRERFQSGGQGTGINSSPAGVQQYGWITVATLVVPHLNGS
jgi:hypothetical protein